jgi:hypothetical protein
MRHSNWRGWTLHAEIVRPVTCRDRGGDQTRAGPYVARLRLLPRPICCQPKARRRARRSPKASCSLDNCHCARCTKNSDEQEFTLRQRKTTGPTCDQGKPDQLPQGWIDPWWFHLTLVLKRPDPPLTRRAGAPDFRRGATHRRVRTCHDAQARRGGHDRLTNAAGAAYPSRVRRSSCYSTYPPPLVRRRHAVQKGLRLSYRDRA